jgi:GTPase SAR1 family protein
MLPENYMSNYRTKVSIPTINSECLAILDTNPQKYMQIWDTPGKEKYRLMSIVAIKSYDDCKVLYDIINKHTYNVTKKHSLKYDCIHSYISIYNPY